jgi:acetyl-CoA carboxylase biotin carboxyl carrier protein
MTEDNTTARAETILKALRVALAGVLEASPVIPARVRLSLNGAELDVSWHDLSIPTIPTVPVDGSGQSATSQPDASADGIHAVRSPLVGTFYRASDPGSTPFVEVGDVVTCGQQLAIVEAMKLMNSIEADCDGQVVEVPVPDGSPVEFDQPLVLIKPTQSGG